MSNSLPRNLVLRFDMRSAPQCEEVVGERYRAAIDMAEWADEQALDVVGLSEHHITDDGFLSSPLGLAGMMLARTQLIRVSVSALLVPLHDPLRLAEDIALLDIASNGRFSATCGLGYRPIEYERFNVSWEHRGAVFDKKLAVLVAALRGERFVHNGGEVRLQPAPQSPLQALLLVGGNSKAAARRAARFNLLFCPAIDDPELDAEYQRACQQAGFEFGMTIFPREPATTFISENPKQSWREIGEFLLYDATAYGAWRHKNRRAYAESFAISLEDLIAEEKYRIVTPEQAIEIIENTGSLHLAPLTGGVPLDAAWQSLQLFADRVRPFV